MITTNELQVTRVLCPSSWGAQALRKASGCMMLGRQINHKKFIYEEFFPLPSLQSYWDPVQQNNNILKAEAVIYSGVNQKRCPKPSGFAPHDSRACLQT